MIYALQVFGPVRLAVDLIGIDADLSYCGLTEAPDLEPSVTIEPGRTDAYERLGINPEDWPPVRQFPVPYADPPEYRQKAYDCVREAQFWCAFAYNAYERAGKTNEPMAQRIYEMIGKLHKVSESIRKGEE